MKTIYEFKKGDEVVRIVPAKPINNMRDRSYMGNKMIFVGIANGQIYLKSSNQLEIRLLGDSLINLSLDIWDDGWDTWLDPLTLLDNEIDPIHIEDKLFDALTAEDYELAEKLKDILTKINNKNENRKLKGEPIPLAYYGRHNLPQVKTKVVSKSTTINRNFYRSLRNRGRTHYQIMRTIQPERLDQFTKDIQPIYNALDLKPSSLSKVSWWSKN